MHRIEELAGQLYTALDEGQHLGRSCPWRPVILKTVFKLLDQESPRLLLKLARLILAVSHFNCSLRLGVLSIILHGYFPSSFLHVAVVAVSF